MKWRAYLDYRPSGMDWLAEVPAHWKVRKLKHIASTTFSSVDKHAVDGEEPVRLCNYTDVYYNEHITSDLEFMEATATQEEIAKFRLRRGDVLVTKDSEEWDDIAVPAYVATDVDNILCGYHLAQVRPNDVLIDGRYLLRSFRARGINDQFRVAATGITRFGLGKYWLDSALFLVPPLDEQRAIAEFLDRETARIDALIAKKQRQIELLEEKRAALITRAVTKGLDPNAKMKDSGVEWLGEIPARWGIRRLRFVSTLQTGLTLGKKYAGRGLVTRPYLRVANVQDGYLDLGRITDIELRREEATRYELRYGDVLMTEGGDFDKLGRGYVWENQIPGCLHQNHLFAVRPNPSELNPHFLAALLASSHGKNYFTSTSQQTTNLATTNSTKLRNFILPLPPVREQDQILGQMRQEMGRLDELTEKGTSSIEKLREYRTALISAAVTGKIDVRGEAARCT
ncbi:MAG: hypothetical protein AB1714_10035 [Acidobacteriota bacterium]